jgi:hypothetical protein
MFSVDVLTAAPADEEPLPVFAKALVAALRAELLFKAVTAAVLDVADDWLPLAREDRGVATVPTVVAAVTVPPGAFVTAVPDGTPPTADTYTLRSESGNCV